MTENKSPYMESIGFQDIIRFFVGIGADHDCPVCKHDKWQIMQFEDSRFAIPAIEYSQGAALRAGEFVVYIYCEKCGYVRLHDRDVIRDWLTKNPMTDG